MVRAGAGILSGADLCFYQKKLAHTNRYVYICPMQSDTRQRILEKNFEAMHEHGYQGMRADKVVKELGITKGAFYHYFEGKQELCARG